MNKMIEDFFENDFDENWDIVKQVRRLGYSYIWKDMDIASMSYDKTLVIGEGVYYQKWASACELYYLLTNNGERHITHYKDLKTHGTEATEFALRYFEANGHGWALPEDIRK